MARVVHLIIRSKDEGGISIRQAREQNITLLGNLSWDIIMNSSKLWYRLLAKGEISNTCWFMVTWSSFIQNQKIRVYQVFFFKNLAWPSLSYIYYCMFWFLQKKNKKKIVACNLEFYRRFINSIKLWPILKIPLDRHSQITL
jgi:hypothetical protein